MLKLQAKHFGFDAKNSLNKVSLLHTQQKNMILEKEKKTEVSTNMQGNTYQIRPKHHLVEIGSMMDKYASFDTDYIAKGRKTLNKNRQPIIQEK